MGAEKVGKRREGETAEENGMTTVKLRKFEKERTVKSETRVVEEECHHQIPSVECDSLVSPSSSCYSSNNRSQEKSKRRMEDDNFIQRRDLEEEELISVDSEVESRRLRKKKKRRSCETVKEAELECFFQVAENDVRNQMLVCSSKYNFDFEKDEPVGGRYEWLKFIP